MKRAHITAHWRIWQLLALILPMILLGAMVLRPGEPVDRPAEQLQPPQTSENSGTTGRAPE